MTEKRKRVEVSAYKPLLDGIVTLLEDSRRATGRAVNSILTATYWEIGRRIVEEEQRGRRKAEYGEQLVEQLASDLTARLGVLSDQRLPDASVLYCISRDYPDAVWTFVSGHNCPDDVWTIAGLPPFLVALRPPSLGGGTTGSPVYEEQTLRCGWSVRQLDRQIASQFYERSKAARRSLTARKQPGDELTPDEHIRDPFVLEFLGLKDEYSEHELEEALIQRLEHFLLELGDDFAFMARQKRLRVGDDWYPRGPALFSSPTRLPGPHRSEARPIFPRRRRSDESLPQLRPRALDPAR